MRIKPIVRAPFIQSYADIPPYTAQIYIDLGTKKTWYFWRKLECPALVSRISRPTEEWLEKEGYKRINKDDDRRLYRKSLAE